MTGRPYGDGLDPRLSEALEGIPPLQVRYSAVASPSEGSLAAHADVAQCDSMSPGLDERQAAA